MVGESAEVEHAAAPVANRKLADGSNNGELSAATYERLRRLAADYLRSERASHTLQATALLHEAFLRVLKQPDHTWRDEGHVIAFAARAMRRILISYGVARTRYKRGGPSVVRLPLDEALDFCAERDLNIVAVDEALEELELKDPRQAQIVELRFFAGLTLDEIADTLKISRATVKRDWATAKLWLRSELSDKFAACEQREPES
jgi:RNA polymerase sigma-70 factor, ECF subfamily